jgi:hypothetical protein
MAKYIARLQGVDEIKLDGQRGTVADCAAAWRHTNSG